MLFKIHTRTVVSMTIIASIFLVTQVQGTQDGPDYIEYDESPQWDKVSLKIWHFDRIFRHGLYLYKKGKLHGHKKDIQIDSLRKFYKQLRAKQVKHKINYEARSLKSCELKKSMIMMRNVFHKKNRPTEKVPGVEEIELAVPSQRKRRGRDYVLSGGSRR